MKDLTIDISYYNPGRKIVLRDTVVDVVDEDENVLSSFDVVDGDFDEPCGKAFRSLGWVKEKK